MDPVSAFRVAAEVAQFVDLAADVFLSLFKYFRSVEHAPKHSLELQQEVFLISTILKDLKSTLETMNDPKIKTGSANTLNDTVVEFSKTLTELESRIAVKDC